MPEFWKIRRPQSPIARCRHSATHRFSFFFTGLFTLASSTIIIRKKIALCNGTFLHSGVNIHGFLLCPQRGRPHPKYFKAGYRQCQKSDRIAVMTFSGAAGIVSSDLLDHHGLTLASLSDGAVTALGKIFPAWMPVSNPVDLWPAMERSDVNTAYRHTIQALCANPTVDAVLLHTFAGGPRWQINLRPSWKSPEQKENSCSCG